MTLNLLSAAAADYKLAIHIVPAPYQPSCCPRCLERPAEAVIGYSRNEPTEGDERDYADSCLACVIPFIDSIDYLNTDIEIDVEVSRNATNRPF
jgi:hypothetical protein